MAARYRRLWRALALLLLLAAAIPLLLAGLAVWQKDHIIAWVVARCNERLQTPVRVDRIDLTIWQTFPMVAVQMDSVIVQESLPGHARRLAALGHVRLGFSPLDLLRGRYRVAYLAISGGYVQMRHLPDGTPNYDILKPDSTHTREAGQPTAFALRRIRLDSLRYRFADEGSARTLVALRLPHADASLQTEGLYTTTSLQTKGAELTRLVAVGNRLADALPIGINSTMVVAAGQQITFRPGKVRLGTADFALQGQVGLGQQAGTYNFKIQNEGSTLAALTVLLPAKARQALEGYKTQGQVFFKAGVEARQAGSTFPRIEASFGARQARFQYADYHLAMTGVALRGDFTLPEGNSLAEGHLRLHQASGQVGGHAFSGRLDLVNLDKPRIAGHAKARLPLAFFAPQLQQAGIAEPSGQMDVDITFATGASGRSKAEGAVALDGLGFVAGQRKLRFAGWQGKLALEGEVLTAEALHGTIGRSDLALEGRLENLLGYLSGTRPALGLEVSLQSQYLDLDELLAAQPQATAPKATTNGTEQDYRFVIAPGLRLSASCQVGRLRFRRFSPRTIRGHISVQNQRLALDDVRFYETGGLFQVTASLDAAPEQMQVQSQFAIEGARMDSLFYCMEDFGQQTLRHNQIQGKLSTKGTVSFGMTHRLDVQPATVVAAAEIKLAEGALLYFEPAQALGRFMDKEELKYLRFSELKNTLTIQNQVVTIPEMDIRSNILRCYVHGTHTFGQAMDYHLRIPTQYLRRSSLEASAASRGGNLFVAMRGTPGHIKVSYDLPALKDKLRDDVREEKQNFINLFKRKPKNETPPQPEDPSEGEKPAEDKFLDLD